MTKWRPTEGKASPVDDQHPQGTAASSGDEISACGGKGDMEVEFNNLQQKMKCLLDNLESFQKDQMTQTEEAPIESVDSLTNTTLFNVRVVQC